MAEILTPISQCEIYIRKLKPGEFGWADGVLVMGVKTANGSQWPVDVATGYPHAHSNNSLATPAPDGNGVSGDEPACR
jgi:hypothetical protein